MAVIDISGLTRLAVNYQSDMRYLPYAVMVETLVNEHQINLLPGIENQDVVTTFLRKRGIAKPLFVGMEVQDSDIGKPVESILKIENAYASVQDDIQNYKEKVIIRPGEKIGQNQTHKHPFEVGIMMGIIRTFSEDILDAVFHAERNTSDLSPMGLFDGFDTKIDDGISDGIIASGLGNIVDSGDFEAPASDTDYTAYHRLRDWLRQAHPDLLKNGVLHLPRLVARYCMDALKNKTKQKADTFISFVDYLNDDVDGNLKVVKSRLMGTGDRINLFAPGNMEFGFNSLSDTTFVKIRDINKNPNIVNYWIQAGFGTRWINFHKKVFMTNTGSLTPNLLSGDYVS